MILYLLFLYCQVKYDVITNNTETIPKNIPATKKANRIIRNGVGLKVPLFLPTPITAFTASLIKTSMYLI